MVPVQFKLPQITLSAGNAVRQQDLSTKTMPVQTADGRPLYLMRSKFRIAGTLTIATAAAVARLARLIAVFKVILPGLSTPLWDVDGRELVVQSMIDRLFRPLPQRTATGTTLALTYKNSSDAFAGLATDAAGGSIAFDVTFTVEWKKQGVRDAEDHVWPAVIARCFEWSLTPSAVTQISESSSHTTAASYTLDVTHELEPRNFFQLPKVIHVSAQPLTTDEPQDILRFDGDYRSLAILPNAADYFTQTKFTSILPTVGGVPMDSEKRSVRLIYDAVQDQQILATLQDHTRIGASSAYRTQVLPLFVPDFLSDGRVTQLPDARVPIALKIDDVENYKILREVELNWTNDMIATIWAKTGLDPADYVLKPYTSSHKPPAEGSDLANHKLPLRTLKTPDFLTRA